MVKASDREALSKCYISPAGSQSSIAMSGTSDTVTFTGLKESTTYTIYVTDSYGTKSATKTVTTGSINYNVANKYWTTTLAQAISKASTGNTIKMTNNYTDTSTVNFNKNVTFNLNGKTLNRSSPLNINSGKTVTINTSATGGKIHSTATGQNLIVNNGILTLSGAMTIDSVANRASGAVLVDNKGTMNIQMQNGTITSDGNTVANNGGTLKINSMTNGNIKTTKSGMTAVWNRKGSVYIDTVNISNTTGMDYTLVNGLEGSVDTSLVMEIRSSANISGFVENRGTMRMSGSAKIVQSKVYKALWNKGNMSMSDNTLVQNSTKDRGTVQNSGDFWLKGGTIKNTTGSTAVWNDSGANFVRQGGTISGQHNLK